MYSIMIGQVYTLCFVHHKRKYLVPIHAYYNIIDCAVPFIPMTYSSHNGSLFFSLVFIHFAQIHTSFPLWFFFPIRFFFPVFIGLMLLFLCLLICSFRFHLWMKSYDIFLSLTYFTWHNTVYIKIASAQKRKSSTKQKRT